MKTDESFGCGNCFLIFAILLIFAMLIFASCNKTVHDGYYGGQIERIDYLTVDGERSMFLHTDKFIVLTKYDRRIELDDSVFLYKTLPVNFYDTFEWIVIDGRKIPIR